MARHPAHPKTAHPKTVHPKTDEMANTLVLAQHECELDLADYAAIHRMLFDAGYTQHQIEQHSDQAVELARARVQREATVARVACVAAMPAIGALAAAAWMMTPGPATAAILSPAGLDAGADITLVGLSTAIGFVFGWLFGLVQFGPRRSKIRRASITLNEARRSQRHV